MFGFGSSQLWDQLTEETNIYFAKNTYQEISRKEAEKVAALARQIRADPPTFVTLVGHASGEGTEQHNQRLSENRALKVKALLLANGVSGNKIRSVRGAGSSERTVPEVGANAKAVEDRRKENRRVHVGFHSDSSRPFDFLKRDDPWEAAKKLPIPGWPPPSGPPPILRDWDKLPFQRKVDEYAKLKETVQDLCERAFVDPGPALDMLKDILFPGPESEGPLDKDLHCGRNRE